MAMYIIQHYHGGTFSTFEKNMFELKRVSISIYCDIFFCKSRYDIDFYNMEEFSKIISVSRVLLSYSAIKDLIESLASFGFS